MIKIIFREIFHGSKEYEEAVALRETILRKPLGLTFTASELEKEKGHIHLAGFLDNKIIATAVLVPEGSQCMMQRVAVNATMQGKGVGTQLMRFCEQIALEKGLYIIHCSARETAIPFYLKNGYKLVGLPYIEDGIPHQKMIKSLINYSVR